MIASSQILLRLARYKEEKLSDLPQAGLLVLSNIMPQQWADVKAEHERGRRNVGHELWSNIMTLIGLDPERPVSADFVSFSNLPDNFDEREATDLYANVVALSFGVDTREFWPLTGGTLGEGRESTIQHQKARGKGVGDLVSSIERAVNWKVMPASATFKFDFRDDEEDAQRAEIQDVKVGTIMGMWKPPNAQEAGMGAVPPVTRGEIRQMLADQTDYFKEDFLVVDITEEETVTDVEREKAYGPVVLVDWKGETRRPATQLMTPLDGTRVDRVLAMAEGNYRAGLLTLDELLEFRLGQVLDERGEVDG